MQSVNSKAPKDMHNQYTVESILFRIKRKNIKKKTILHYFEMNILCIEAEQ